MAKKAAPKKRIIKGRDYNEDKRSDGLRQAKSGGWRISGTNRKPTKKEIQAHYNGASNGVYMENRISRMDKNPRAKKGERFDNGGEIKYDYERGKNYPVKTVSKDDYEKLGLENYPNFSKTGSISGMKKQYYGKDALLVKCGNYIYNVTSNPEIYFNDAYEYGGEIESEEYKKGGKVDRSKSAKKPRVKRTKKAIAQDKNIKALHAGKRISENDNIYWESRPNRSDENRTKKLAKGGDLKNYTSADLPKDGSEIKIHMPEMGKFPAEDIVLKYNQDNFAFDAYRNGELSATRITEKQVLDNLNNGSYEFKNGSNFKYKKGDVVYVYQYHSDPRNSSTDSIRNSKEEIEKYLSIDKKYIVGKKPSQQKWSKVEILEPWSDEKGWESYKVKQLDGYRKENEFVANQSQMAKTNNGTIAIGYMEEGGEVEEYAKGGKIKLREIEDETVLMPYVIAEPIAETAAEITLRDEFSKWESLSKSEKEALDEKYKNLVDEISVYLVKRANTVYTHNKSFEKDVKGKKGREVLNTFMEHWCGLVDGKLVYPISETMARYEKESKSTTFEHGGDIYPIENERKQPIKSGMILMVKDTKDEADKFVSDKPELVVEEFEGKWAIKKYAKGGKLGFEGLAKKVAKEYEGDKVKPEYQDEYGKRYDKEEAKEVGQKVAAKVYREQQGMMEQGGEIKSELTLSEIESKLGKTFGFWSVPYQVSVDGIEYRKKFGSSTYRKV